jgi:hypothetical protein
MHSEYFLESSTKLKPHPNHCSSSFTECISNDLGSSEFGSEQEMNRRDFLLKDFWQPVLSLQVAVGLRRQNVRIRLLPKICS